MSEDDSKVRKVADSAALILTSRVSGPLLLMVCTWIGSSVVNLKTDVAALSAGMTATIAAINGDVNDLKARFNTMEANYNSNANSYGYGRHPN